MKPFLKWVGGKNKIASQIEAYAPKIIHENYCEPFLGGGAMFFYLVQKYYFRNVVLSDISKDLIDTYVIVQKKPLDLIRILNEYKTHFLASNSKEDFYYQIREKFNERSFLDKVEKSAIFIFLNKTCFNGLYRLNSKGLFNVPFGFYKNPSFYDEENILSCSKCLQNVEIVSCDFLKIENYLSGKSFIYLDPPYRPITKTSSFNNYSGKSFSDSEQERLATFIKILSAKDHQILLSNSYDESDYFFDLYKDFFIHKIKASRNINSVGSKRGKIEELLISNYE